MRTNIVLDDRIVTEAMKLTKAKTKRDVVDSRLARDCRASRTEKRARSGWPGLDRAGLRCAHSACEHEPW